MTWDPTALRWGDDLRAQLEQLAGDYRERLAQLRQMQMQAARVTAVARSRDGLVSVVVGAQGQLLSVELDPGVYERMPPERLAAMLVELAGAAAADAAEQVRVLIAAVLPAGWVPGEDAGALIPPGLSLLGGGLAARRR